MFDFAWSELLVIAVVALVVIGPKDLPRVMRVVAIWIRKARSMAAEFQSSFEDMAREAELDEIHKEAEAKARAAEVPPAIASPLVIHPPAPEPYHPDEDGESPGDEAAIPPHGDVSPRHG